MTCALELRSWLCICALAFAFSVPVQSKVEAGADELHAEVERLRVERAGGYYVPADLPSTYLDGMRFRNMRICDSAQFFANLSKRRVRVLKGVGERRFEAESGRVSVVEAAKILEASFLRAGVMTIHAENDCLELRVQSSPPKP